MQNICCCVTHPAAQGQLTPNVVFPAFAASLPGTCPGIEVCEVYCSFAPGAQQLAAVAATCGGANMRVRPGSLDRFAKQFATEPLLAMRMAAAALQIPGAPGTSSYVPVTQGTGGEEPVPDQPHRAASTSDPTAPY